MASACLHNLEKCPRAPSSAHRRWVGSLPVAADIDYQIPARGGDEVDFDFDKSSSVSSSLLNACDEREILPSSIRNFVSGVLNRDNQPSRPHTLTLAFR